MISKMCTRKPAKSQTDRYFPALFKDTQSNLVVMFLDRTTGVVLVGNSFFGIGDVSKNFICCDIKEDWELLDSSYVIKLVNR